MVERQAITVGVNEDPVISSVEQEIHQAREQVAATVTQLQKRVDYDLNWRRVIAHRPLTVVTIAVGVGAFVGFATTPKLVAAPPPRLNPNPRSNFWTPTITTIVTYAIREGSKYLFDRILNDKNSTQ